MVSFLHLLPVLILTAQATFQGCFSGVQGSEPDPAPQDESSCITSCISNGTQYAGHHPTVDGHIECSCAIDYPAANLSSCASTMAPWKVYLLGSNWRFLGCFDKSTIGFNSQGTVSTPQEAFQDCTQPEIYTTVLELASDPTQGWQYECFNSPYAGTPKTCNPDRYYVYGTGYFSEGGIINGTS